MALDRSEACEGCHREKHVVVTLYTVTPIKTRISLDAHSPPPPPSKKASKWRRWYDRRASSSATRDN
ncbi:hypothetical protein QJS10_CPB14g00868 [Acorus calamus]|uniref:Uncharacterized protein n=1 Tax=Acorus calamus TaxID=4465 RepID=A0AAV9DCN4_ACOCL|nr:hypothetical protein QJS10_CPB14g00868 [Acorus calamus]